MQRTYNAGAINFAIASGSMGGLVGGEGGSITLSDSYNIGTLTLLNSTATGVTIGGLVGFSNTGAGDIVQRSYNAGTIIANQEAAYASVGALFGGTAFPTSTANFYDSNTTGAVGNTTGGTALTTANMQLFASFSSWGSNITATPALTGGLLSITNWFIFNGSTRPILSMEYNATINNAHQLQLAGAVLNGNYTLSNTLILLVA